MFANGKRYEPLGMLTAFLSAGEKFSAEQKLFVNNYTPMVYYRALN
jgi:hypothetical protein